MRVDDRLVGRGLCFKRRSLASRFLHQNGLVIVQEEQSIGQKTSVGARFPLRMPYTCALMYSVYLIVTLAINLPTHINQFRCGAPSESGIILLGGLLRNPQRLTAIILRTVAAA